MATNVAGRRYRTCYAMLLRLYPRPFRERFGEGMAQTFHDLCREHGDAKRGLRGLALWIFFETSVGIVKENTTHMPQILKTMLRVALGALAALMVPLVASRVVEGWNWSAGGFVFVYVLFFATGMAYALIAKKMNIWAYKVGVGLALVTGFAFGWSNMVQVADSGHPENLVYYSVLVVGIVGALLARLEPVERVLVTLLHLEGRSGKEVAQAMGWSHLRVRVQGFRVRQKLKHHLRHLMHD